LADHRAGTEDQAATAVSEPDDELPLLLHSLTAVAKQITAAPEIVQPGAIVEIGSETGGMTELLVEWAREHEATLICVDPEPAPHVRRLEVEGAPVHVASEFSPEGLAGIDGEAWIIDGDHNHATVTAELRHVFGGAGTPRLAVLHDVAWPWARRDLYYAPERIAAAHRRPLTSRGGVVPGVPGTVASGFGGRGRFAWAEQEGASATVC